MTDQQRASESRAERLSNRRQTRKEREQPEASPPPDEAASAQPVKTAKMSKTESESVKTRPSVMMYLPEELHGELDARFDELNARHKRRHGTALEKNRDYYPAVIEAGLTGQDLEELLNL